MNTTDSPTVHCAWCSEHIGGPAPDPNRAGAPASYSCCDACYLGLLAEFERGDADAAGPAAEPLAR